MNRQLCLLLACLAVAQAGRLMGGGELAQRFLAAASPATGANPPATCVHHSTQLPPCDPARRGHPVRLGTQPAPADAVP